MQDRFFARPRPAQGLDGGLPLPVGPETGERKAAQIVGRCEAQRFEQTACGRRHPPVAVDQAARNVVGGHRVASEAGTSGTPVSICCIPLSEQDFPAVARKVVTNPAVCKAR